MESAMRGDSALQLVSKQSGFLPLSQMTREGICDEFGELKRQELLFKPKADRLKTLRSVIAGWIPESHPPDQPVSFEGQVYTINCTPRQNERRVSNPAKLLKFLGAAKFWKLVQIGVGALEDLLGKKDAEAWFLKAPTGSREISAVAKAPLIAPAA